MSNTLTASKVEQLDDGWVNDKVVGRVTSAKNFENNDGSTTGTCYLGDDDTTITVKSKHKSFMPYNNKTVELSGQGMSWKTYKGKSALWLGAGSVISVVEQGGGEVPTAEDAPVRPAAPAKTDDDFVPQTLCHVMGAALTAAVKDPQCDGLIPKKELVAQYMVVAYEARDLAVAQIRGGL